MAFRAKLQSQCFSKIMQYNYETFQNVKPALQKSYTQKCLTWYQTHH